VGGKPTLKYHYSERYFTYFVGWSFGVTTELSRIYAGYARGGQGVVERAGGGRVGTQAGRRQKPSGTDLGTCAGTVTAPPHLCACYPSERKSQVGSLAGAAHLLKGNAGVLR